MRAADRNLYNYSRVSQEIHPEALNKQKNVSDCWAHVPIGLQSGQFGLSDA